MAVTTSLATGLGGAIGSDFRRTSNRLIFVEFDGKISRVDLLRTLHNTVFTGNVTMPADTSLNLMTGAVGAGGHIRLDHNSPGGQLVMRPQASCELSYLGAVDYNAVTFAELQELTYGVPNLSAQPGPGDLLTNGAVFAVWNRSFQPASAFDFAKVRVINAGPPLQLAVTVFALNPAYQVLGTGYNQPEDIVVRSDERTAYVTERAGNFLRVDLTNANRPSAALVAGGLNAPHQIALDEVRNQAYVVEFASPGRLVRIDLGTGSVTTLVNNLDHGIGLLVTSDGQYAYVGEQAAGGSRVSRITLNTGNREQLAGGLTNPFFLTFTDAGESGILCPLRDPANQIALIDLAQVPPVLNTLVGTAFRPSSVAVVSPDRLLVCANDRVDRVDLTTGIIGATGPMLLGIGLIPVDHISRSTPVNPATDGYADTAADAGYPLRVKDTPFGGGLAILFNHDRAFAEGARFYRLDVDGTEPLQAFSDYQWDTPSNAFVLRTRVPLPGGYYPVRTPGELWLNHWWGYYLDTSVLSNGLHTIHVRLFAQQTPGSEIGNANQAGRSAVVQIDNSAPLAVIDQIIHDGSPVGACAIVNSGSHNFTFHITALDPQQNLLSWSLVALWGDNKSKAVASDDYSHHISATKKWDGVGAATTVPTPPAPAWDAEVSGDSTSLHCAHTFRLAVWDRVINGYGYIHYNEYNKSITLML